MNRCIISHISNVTDFTTTNVAGSGGATNSLLILGDLSRRTRFGAGPQIGNAHIGTATGAMVSVVWHNTAETLKPGQNRLSEASSQNFWIFVFQYYYDSRRSNLFGTVGSIGISGAPAWGSNPRRFPGHHKEFQTTEIPVCGSDSSSLRLAILEL